VIAIKGKQLTIRARLALWYGAVFAVTGVALLATIYLLVREELYDANTAMVTALQVEVPSNDGTTTATSYAKPAIPVGVIAEAADESRRDALQVIMVESGIVLVVMAAVALVLCWLVASRALGPLRRITDVAGRLSQDTLDSRIALSGPPDELKTLADTFDGMLERLGRAFEAQRLFAANASHELRTPMTIIQAAAEKALSRPTRAEAEYRQALSTVAAAARRSERLLASLLRLAQTRRRVRCEPVDLAETVSTVVRGWPRSGPALRIEPATTPAQINADPVLLELLLRNLLENAVRYNTTDGSVWLRVRAHGNRRLLRVENTGPPVDPDDLPALRQAFRRGAHRTSTGGNDGFGLGLAIVDAIVVAHDGTWHLLPREGGGLIVTIDLPVG
jgi:signal transduction histidine kinase